MRKRKSSTGGNIGTSCPVDGDAYWVKEDCPDKSTKNEKQSVQPDIDIRQFNHYY